MSVFDGMADIFADTFGEAVDYTPLATSITKRITAIWWEAPLSITIGDVAVEGGKTQLSLRAADISVPAEGDTARRISDGKLMTVTTPIDADGKGIIVCNLAET